MAICLLCVIVWKPPGSQPWHDRKHKWPTMEELLSHSDQIVTQIGDGEKFDYVVYHLEGAAIGGRMQMTAEWGDLPAHWMTYFRVADTETSAARVRELGGNVLHGPFDSPHGRIAVVSDPYGAVFSIIGPAPTAAS